MKLSFSLPSKSTSKPNPNKPSNNFTDEDHHETSDGNDSNREFVTQFDPSKTLAESKKIVIPPKPNEWRPLKKMKNLDIPLQSHDPNDLKFELSSCLDKETDSTMNYGLNLRKSTANNDEQQVDGNERLGSGSVESELLQKLKDDLTRLPDEQGFDEFKEVPVEGFASAILAGYGWQQGEGIGKNTKEDVKVVEIKKRTGKEGLCFVSDMPSTKIQVGKDVRVIGGRHVGLKGRVLEVPESNSIVLRLSRSEEEVKVRVNEVAELGSVEEEKCLKRLKELKIREMKDDGNRSERRGDGGFNDVEEKRAENKRSREEGSRRDNEFKHGDNAGSNSRKTEQKSVNLVSWIMSHIRVRIISKEFKGGRLYLKRGKVVDVVGPATCDISMDDSRELIQGVNQDLLETAIPRSGGRVLVLCGKHKGVFGYLVERDLDKETGIVRDADSHALLNVRLEQIAEYIGDPSSIGY
ncbi:Spp2/MOS2, G-patch domain [Dillenia turbinata]|uniref:Spp2/MOS2, G-patch domain n=1 Tax=Dillenia turbinata TaxID=194707 RepID=A0AAN8W6Y2_9MAGN